MKITPIVGTPPIANGVEIGNAQKPTALKMKVNRTVNRDSIGPTPTEPVVEEKNPEEKLVEAIETAQPAESAETTPPTEPKTGEPDASVQANEAAEATAPLSPQLAAIAKDRRALQQERQSFEAEKTGLAEKFKAELKEKLKSPSLWHHRRWYAVFI